MAYNNSKVRDNLPTIIRVWLKDYTKAQATKWAKERGWEKFHCAKAANESKGYWVVRGYSKPEDMPERFHWKPLFLQDFSEYITVSVGWGNNVERFRVPRAVAKVYPNNRERLMQAHTPEICEPLDTTDDLAL